MSLTSTSNEAASMKSKNPIARWGRYHKWNVTPDQLHTFSSLSLSDEWNSDKKKRAAIEITITFPYYKELFSNISIESAIKTWRSKLGKTACFYIGSNTLATGNKYRLTKVSVSNVEQNRGTVVHADVDLTFTEVKGTAKKKSTKRKSGAGKKVTKKIKKKRR